MDFKKFENFSLNNLNNETNFVSFSNYYNNNYIAQRIFNDEITARELVILIVLEGSRLILAKTNSNFSDWKMIQEINNGIINVNCN